MHLRRLIVGLGFVTLLGCSGSTSLIVHNLTDNHVSGHIEIQTTYAKKRNLSSKEFSLAAGDSIETVHWFKDSPDWLTVSCEQTGQTTTSTTFKAKDYPEGMQVGTSAGAWYFLEIRESGLELRAPNRWEVYKRNPQYPIFVAGLILSFATIVILIVRFYFGRSEGTLSQNKRLDQKNPL